MGFPDSSVVKESSCSVGDLGSIPGLGRSRGVGHGNPLQYSCLENPHGQRSLAGCSLWGCKESDTTEWLSTSTDISDGFSRALMEAKVPEDTVRGSWEKILANESWLLQAPWLWNCVCVITTASLIPLTCLPLPFTLSLPPYSTSSGWPLTSVSVTTIPISGVFCILCFLPIFEDCGLDAEGAGLEEYGTGG